MRDATAMMAADEGTLHSHEISSAEFHAIARIVYANFGIVLSEEKRSLVVGRLHGSLARRGLSSFSDYIKLLKGDARGEILSELVNQISTNFTSFYREASHFEFLEKEALAEVLARLQHRRSNDIRIWCAACATGEEAYTLQITLMRRLGLQYPSFEAGLLATDISAKALDIAKRGLYGADQVGTVRADVLQSYFKQQADGRYLVKDQVRSEIMFRRLNLMNQSFPFKRPFQIIFCRNVMIYFDEGTRRTLVRKFVDLLEPGGYLFIGHSETINPEWTTLQCIMPAVYRKRV